MPDPLQIQLDFERVARETGVTMEAAYNEVVNEVAREIVRTSPVRTGRLRASWFFSPTFPAIAQVAPKGVVYTPQSARGIVATLGKMGGPVPALDGSLYFLNGTNYAKFVEARTQFVRRVINKAKQIEAKTIAKIARLQRGS